MTTLSASLTLRRPASASSSGQMTAPLFAESFKYALVYGVVIHSPIIPSARRCLKPGRNDMDFVIPIQLI